MGRWQVLEAREIRAAHDRNPTCERALQPGPGIGHLLVVASHSQGNCSWQRHTILTPRWLAETPVEVGDKGGRRGTGRLVRADAAQPELLHEPLLRRQVGALYDWSRYPTLKRNGETGSAPSCKSGMKQELTI
jgi:hypothetical protein